MYKYLSLIFMLCAAQLLQAQSVTVFTHTFENGTEGWQQRGGGESVTTSSAYKFSGSKSLKVSNRTSFWNGACLQRPEFVAGEKLTFSGRVFIPSGDAATVEFCLQYTADGTTNYPILATIALTPNTWKRFDAEVTIPSNASGVYVYFQTSSDSKLVDFYIDDVTCSVVGKPLVVSLHKLYSPYFKVGTAISNSEMQKSVSQAIVDLHYNSITAENDMKPEAVLNHQKSIAAGEPVVEIPYGARVILDYCKAHSLPVRGHCLVWHSQMPLWFFYKDFDTKKAMLTADEMNARMKVYIKKVFDIFVDAYPTVDFYAWDVVNEVFQDGNGTLRVAGTDVQNGQSPWTRIYGDDTFVHKAFEYARMYAPANCKLYYNDFNEYIPAKRDTIKSMVSKMYAKGICDGIGMQSHLATNYPSVQQYEQALQAFTSIGCDVQVTELDITIDNGRTEADQAQMYSDLFDLYVKYSDNISAVVLWGIYDGMSWRKSGSPLIYDVNYQPKAAYYSIIDGLQMPAETPVRHVQAASEVKVWGGKGVLHIQAPRSGSLTVWRIDGSVACTIDYEQGRTSLSLPQGIYIAAKQKAAVR